MDFVVQWNGKLKSKSGFAFHFLNCTMIEGDCQSKQPRFVKYSLQVHLHPPCWNELVGEVQLHATFTKRWARFAASLFFLCSSSASLNASLLQASMLFMLFDRAAECCSSNQTESPQKGCTSITSPSETIWKFWSSFVSKKTGNTSSRSQEQLHLLQLKSSNSTYLPFTQIVIDSRCSISSQAFI